MTTGLETARILLDTNSVLINAKEPFTYTSGRKAPVYTDCRRLISFPQERSKLMDMAVELLKKEIDIDSIDFIAGGETAGIPYAAFIADRLNKPMLYVRKKPKGVGRMAQIEGAMEEAGANVLLVEDLQTDGGSKKVFVDALREAGANIAHAFVVYHYGILPASETNMKDMGLTLHELATMHDVMSLAIQEERFDDATIASLKEYMEDPVTWSLTHGGVGD